jgi:hypothetical protein
MTGGGDLDEVQHEEFEETVDEVLDEESDPNDDVEPDELGSAADGEADAPVEFGLAIDENDTDPTAGASDIGGLAGGIDDDPEPREGSTRR